MRRIFLLGLVAALAVGCFGCATQDKTEGATASATETTSATTTTLIFTIYPPNEILLNEINEQDYLEDEDFGWVPCYRDTYFSLPGWLTRMVAPDQRIEFQEYCESSKDGSDRMAVALFVKYFNIPKSEFEKGEREDWEACVRIGFDMTTPKENNEPANADIIYTFDNDIINAYYRRENPVAPDWSKVKTYESYAAYKEANP